MQNYHPEELLLEQYVFTYLCQGFFFFFKKGRAMEESEKYSEGEKI